MAGHIRCLLGENYRDPIWAVIFGRLLAGFLHAHRTTFEDFDLVIPSPTYIGPGGRSFDHTAEVLREAASLDEIGLPFAIDQPVLVKTRPTKRLVDCSGWQERRHVCENELPRALAVPAPARVRGKSILVYDDVFTDGLNINSRGQEAAGGRRAGGLPSDPRARTLACPVDAATHTGRPGAAGPPGRGPDR